MAGGVQKHFRALTGAAAGGPPNGPIGMVRGTRISRGRRARHYTAVRGAPRGVCGRTTSAWRTCSATAVRAVAARIGVHPRGIPRALGGDRFAAFRPARRTGGGLARGLRARGASRRGLRRGGHITARLGAPEGEPRRMGSLPLAAIPPWHAVERRPSTRLGRPARRAAHALRPAQTPAFESGDQDFGVYHRPWARRETPGALRAGADSEQWRDWRAGPVRAAPREAEPSTPRIGTGGLATCRRRPDPATLRAVDEPGSAFAPFPPRA